MAKYFGKVGYSITEEVGPGDWIPKITEVKYAGDTERVRNIRNSSDKVNDDLKISSVISILADPFAFENFQHIAYAEFMGTLWKVTDIQVEFPRLKLTLGGVYNGPQT